MKNIVFLTGAGMSAESGISTFRDSGGLWEQYPVMQVASHSGWEANPELVTTFYNDRRRDLLAAKPCGAHRMLARMEANYNVCIITQNVDDLHERGGSTNIVHLHGELMKVCSSRDVEDPRYWQVLTAQNWEVPTGAKAGDGSLLRPYIVFFEEAVPKISEAAERIKKADVFVIIGSSLNVYPAASLIAYTQPGIPIFIIDPKDVNVPYGYAATHIKAGATKGVGILLSELEKRYE